MIIGSHDTFIGVKKSSVVDIISFSHYEPQENFNEIVINFVNDAYIQTGQDP